MTFLIIITCLVFMAGQALGLAPQLYIADGSGNRISRMVASGGSTVPVGGGPTFGVPIAVAYDPVAKFIYWADSSYGRKIGRLLLASDTRTLIPTGFASYGLAVESSTGDLFVPDYDGNKIKVLNFDAKTWRTIVDNVFRPLAVVADNQGRWLYWSTHGSKLIERSNMRGESRTILVSTDLNWPNGIALDTPGGRLFFCDTNLHFVDSLSLDGRRNRIRHVSNSSGNSLRFRGITLDENYIYVTAEGQRNILRMNKTAVEATTLERIGDNVSTAMWGLVLTGSSACGGTLSDTTGIFSSPENNNKEDCEWMIKVHDGNQLNLVFKSFNIPGPCKENSVKVYDVTTETALYDSCGNAPTGPLTSSGNVMRIVFKTNPSQGLSGFTALYYSTVLQDFQNSTAAIIILGILLFFAALGISILCRKNIQAKKSSKEHNRISNIHDYDYINHSQLGHQSGMPREQPALPIIAMITGERAAFSPGSGQRPLPEPPRGIQDCQGNSGRQVSHEKNDNEKQQAICGPSDMDDGYLSPRIAAMTQGASASCELPENNGNMTGHNNTDVSTNVIDQGQRRDTKKSVEMNESGPQAQEDRAISSGAAAFLGTRMKTTTL